MLLVVTVVLLAGAGQLFCPVGQLLWNAGGQLHHAGVQLFHADNYVGPAAVIDRGFAFIMEHCCHAFNFDNAGAVHHSALTAHLQWCRSGSISLNDWWYGAQWTFFFGRATNLTIIDIFCNIFFLPPPQQIFSENMAFKKKREKPALLFIVIITGCGPPPPALSIHLRRPTLSIFSMGVRSQELTGNMGGIKPPSSGLTTKI